MPENATSRTAQATDGEEGEKKTEAAPGAVPAARPATAYETDGRTCAPAGNAPAVSVIVPAYNAERYLRQCIDSVLCQTLQNIEVICVNDGSTDGTLEILRAYEAADPRVRVLDVPNGGYGRAVNRGIDAAQGEYIAVMESDDFAEEHMYADLFVAARGDGVKQKNERVRHVDEDHPADIVKSSYWNYYDLEDGSKPYIEPSNLMGKMPDEPFAFTVHTNWEVLYHHPSIWSAIYRRDFLEEKRIRMIEPEGAGWADNPFLFETLVQASAIVWVPGAYYHYRQTNPGSSSYLKDFHLPFDRLRDIRSLLDRLGERDPHVIVCLYNRTFSYIKSVLEKFHFPESDPAVFAAVKEALESMDPDILYGAKKGIRRDQIEYYEDVMGKLEKKVKPHGDEQSPQISIVVSMRDVRPYIWKCLDSIAKQVVKSFEVVCIDCGSRDRTVEVASYFANADKRFSVESIGEASIPEGLAAGLARARGEIVYFADPRCTFGKKFLKKVCRAFKECSRADMLVFAKKLRYLKGIEVPAKHGKEVKAKDIRDRLVIAAPNAVSSKAYRRSFLESAGVALDAGENPAAALFSVKTIAAARYVALMGETEPKRQSYRSVRSPLAYLERESALAQARSTMFERLNDFAKQTEDGSIVRGVRCFMVEAMLADLKEIDNVDEERKYFDRMKVHFDRFGLAKPSSSYFINADSYRKLRRLTSMEYDQYLTREMAANRDQTRIIRESTAYRLGSKIADIGPRLLPKKFAMRIRKMV